NSRRRHEHRRARDQQPSRRAPTHTRTVSRLGGSDFARRLRTDSQYGDDRWQPHAAHTLLLLLRYGCALQQTRPGTGCDALEGFNRMHAILGASEACIATHPSDMCVALAALDATVQVTGANGKRAIPLVDFHRLPEDTPQTDTNLQPDELITAVE